MNKYFPVIGMEIHVELKTKSKMFCQCSANYFGKEPNSNTCPVCLGMPGALPVPNKQAVEWTVKIGKALNCSINKRTKFDRKHYYYPDLPKGYQISQYDEPIAVKGHLDITLKGKDNTLTEKRFNITRVHLEEDTGKLTHAGEDTLVDFNRSSVPLVEIVTEPDFENADDVKVFLEELHTIIRTLDVSDADMEKGSMRMEPNISLSIYENKEERMKNLPKYKVEVKNINSFNFAKKAIEYELKRQAEILDKGEIPAQETRGYNEDKGITYSQRSKEEAQDYRYFPEPDIPPMEFTDEFIEKVEKTIPELPASRVKRYLTDYQLKYDDAFILTRDTSLSKYYEKLIAELSKEKELDLKKQNLEQAIANVIVNKRIQTNLSHEEFAQKFVKMFAKVEIDESQLHSALEKAIQENPKAITDYKSGKTNAVMALVGSVMREMRGQADAMDVRKRLEQLIQDQA
ncbi:Asp-tRNA(Asn)/Glu-tRNA(Gln) amidotransferase subunit GatB [Candidatus Roizmanbacteria bacterium]|nr:MAG: Asp-tRNA(Asn)/Glu-tRNA(Gln) amidotransferase subunit GatB [Candidatus Roizmanbacteria bacterium]